MQEQKNTNCLSQQKFSTNINFIYSLFFQNPTFTQIDHIVSTLPQDLYNQNIDLSINFPVIQTNQKPQQHCQNLEFLVVDNGKCLLITEKAFNYYYKRIVKYLRQIGHKLMLYQMDVIEFALKCTDILICMNGENELVWNIKKTILRDNTFSNKQKLDLNHELRINSAILMKFKKSMVCYQFRLQLVEKQLQDLFCNFNQNMKKQMIVSIDKILKRQRQLTNRILERFFRNYYCWMYKLKLTKFLFQKMLPKLFIQLQISEQIEQALEFCFRIFGEQIENIHKFVQKNPNDHSAIHYLKWITSKQNPVYSKILQDKQILKQQYTKYSYSQKQLQWCQNTLEFCKSAYQNYKQYQILQHYYQQLYQNR